MIVKKTLLLVTLVVVPAAYPETTPPATEAFQSPQKGCLTVKHKGTVGRRLIFATLTGVPIALGAKYDLVDSLDYQGAKLSYKGKELEQIQKTGTRIVVLPSKPRPEEVKDARESCFCEPKQKRSGVAAF
jgi:hypothetical protein